MSNNNTPQQLPPHQDAVAGTAPRRRLVIPVVIAVGVVLVLVVGLLLHHSADEKINKVALSASPKDVTVVKSQASSYLPTHRYVGTLRPWTEAKVGPQFLAAYVNTVLVRPGAVVKRNQVLGTLDCRNASARSRAVDLGARALQAEQTALASQAQRMTSLLDGGYIAENDVDQRTAASQSEEAKVEAERSNLVAAELSVNDCVLRAPFDGDVGERWVDPGAFVRPGEAVVSVVDRSVVRLVVDVPESDYTAVAPESEVQIHVLALDQHLTAHVSRRSPAADPGTRTIHIEIDLPDPKHHMPVNTTAEILVGVGKAVPATSIPLIAADLNQDKAKLFTVADQVVNAQTLRSLGEAGGDLYFSPKLLPPNTDVVLEGRASLNDKDKVTAKEAQAYATPDAGAVDGEAEGDETAGGEVQAQLTPQLTPETPTTAGVTHD